MPIKKKNIKIKKRIDQTPKKGLTEKEAIEKFKETIRKQYNPKK
jgi:hypothetical protein